MSQGIGRADRLERRSLQRQREKPDPCKPRVRYPQVQLLFGLDEVAASVPGVAGFGGFHAEGLFFTPTGGVEPAFRDAKADKILHDGIGATLAEREVVFGGTTFVA